MSENKRFKAFRNTLTESEYKETLTGYPNRGIDTEDGPYRFDAKMLVKINAMLNAISRSTFQSPNDAFIKIKTRLNLMMLDFPWTPALWGSMGQVPPASALTGGGALGVVTLTVTRFGRVDGVDGITGEIRTDGKANGSDPFQEFTLLASIELAEDGLYRVNAKIMPKVEVVPEGVEHDGDALDEMAQTASREAEMKRKLEKHDEIAQRAYNRKMTGTPKQSRRARKVEGKHDRAIISILKRSSKEEMSPRTYGRGGKLVKRGSRHEVKEEIEQIDELLTPMRDKITARALDKATADYNNPNLSAAQQKKAGARASRATYARLRARSNDGTVAGKAQTPKFKRENEKWRKIEKSVKEGVEAIEEMHKAGDTVKVPHKGKMVKGKIVRHDSGGSSKAAQHGGGYVVDVGEHGSITVPHHQIVKEEWKSLKKTKADLNAIRASGKKVSVQHGEGDTLYRVSKAKKPVKEEAEQIDELSKATKDAYVRKRGSQLQRMTTGLDRYRNLLTGKKQANAVKGIKQAMGVKEEAELDEMAGAAKAARLAKAKERAGREGDADRFERASAVQKRIIARLHKKKGRVGDVSEELVGGQKKLDVNKNKRLDAQDFKLLRAKKKPVNEYTEFMPGIPLQSPPPTEAIADNTGKGKRFHKKALKSVAEAVAKVKKPKPHAGAAGEAAKQARIKNRLSKYGMRW